MEVYKVCAPKTIKGINAKNRDYQSDDNDVKTPNTEFEVSYVYEDCTTEVNLVVAVSREHCEDRFKERIDQTIDNPTIITDFSNLLFSNIEFLDSIVMYDYDRHDDENNKFIVNVENDCSYCVHMKQNKNTIILTLITTSGCERSGDKLKGLHAHNDQYVIDFFRPTDVVTVRKFKKEVKE